MRQKLIFILGLCVGATMLHGCVALAVGAAAHGGIAVVQDQSIGEQFDDVAILFDVSSRLEKDPERFGNVSVDVTEGRVLLTGNVKTPEDRVEAIRLAWQAADVVEVINEIVVADSGGFQDYFDDVRISTALRAALLFDTDVFNLNYNVETVNGVIYLTGIARSNAELEKAIGHARMIEGAKEVISYVRVK